MITVQNLNKKFRLNERFIKKLAGQILGILKKPRDTKLDIVFLNSRAMRYFNKRYKHADRATDVLSFDLDSCAQILISPDAALKNSGIFNTSFEEEIVLYVIHGILHLFGYDDETKPEKDRMSKKEGIILKRLCQKNLLKVLTRR